MIYAFLPPRQNFKRLTVLLWVPSSEGEVDPHVSFPPAQRPIEMAVEMCKREYIHSGAEYSRWGHQQSF